MAFYMDERDFDAHLYVFTPLKQHQSYKNVLYCSIHTHIILIKQHRGNTTHLDASIHFQTNSHRPRLSAHAERSAVVLPAKVSHNNSTSPVLASPL